MDIRKIKKLIEMLQASDLNEIEIQEGEESVRISRGSTQPIEVKSTPVELQNVNTVPESNDAPNIDSGSSIKSPIVGTFYRKPAPDKNPAPHDQDPCIGYMKPVKITTNIKKLESLTLSATAPLTIDAAVAQNTI